MTQKFKFFRGFIGTINTMDGETYATASFYDPRTLTEDERLTRINERIIRAEDFNGRITMSQEQYNLNRDMFAEHERVRRQRIDNDNQIRLFQATTTITVNPTLWTKVKIFGTRVKLVLIETWKLEPIGVVVISMLITLLTIIGIAKLFGA